LSIRSAAAPPSSERQALNAGRDDPAQRRELYAERFGAISGQAIGMTPVVGGQRFDPASFLQAQKRAIEGAWLQDCPAEAPDILDHRVAMLVTVRETQHDEQRDISEAAKVGKVVGHVTSPRRPLLSATICSTDY
jgi:hypothetical protein